MLQKYPDEAKKRGKIEPSKLFVETKLILSKFEVYVKFAEETLLLMK